MYGVRYVFLLSLSLAALQNIENFVIVLLFRTRRASNAHGIGYLPSNALANIFILNEFKEKFNFLFYNELPIIPFNHCTQINWPH